MEYDVIVVGAGPGGSTAAYTAAKKGLRVLMLEKRQAVGEPVRCAEGITESTRARFDIPKHVIANTVTRSEVISPSGKTSVLEGKGHILERIASDKFLAMRAVDAGAELSVRTRAVDVKETGGGVEVTAVTPQEKTTFTAKTVIGADGRESNVAKWFGIDTKLQLSGMYKSFQYEMVMHFDADTIKMYLGNEVAKGGYVWVFPKGESRANVGVCIPGDTAVTAKEVLDRFIMKNAMEGSVVRSACGTIPIVPAKHALCGERFMLVGDAARFVNPIHGGGMEEAMISGEMAGEAAAEGRPSAYGERVKELSERGKKVVKLNKIMRALSDDDLDAIISSLSAAELSDAVSGHNLRAIVALFKKRPSLLKFVPKLL